MVMMSPSPHFTDRKKKNPSTCKFWFFLVGLLLLLSITPSESHSVHHMGRAATEEETTVIEPTAVTTATKETHSETTDTHADAATSTGTEEEHTDDHHPVDFDQLAYEGESHAEHESEPGHAVLFPSFTMALGVVVFYILTRYWAALPYTAVMFLIGTIMGIAAELMPDQHDHVAVTTRMWAAIDSEVLLLVFLPGLIFKDAFGLNVHLFRVGATQCLIYAFPMVLLGTFLTACVGRYVFPYGWSWNLALTFGSILAATDPVAVAALLEEVGAPPRLKVHIGGEALLNDGAAIVFFTIFAERYFYELGEQNFGEEVGWARGFELFFRMSLGGMAIGIAFGWAMLIVLWLLNRRFSQEENIVEVTATAAIAYLGYYVAEVVCHTSGVIATVACGVTVKAMGRALINDSHLLDDFWVLLEHMLNTVLFTLGGVVWGAVIANGESHGVFGGEDWAFLIVLYVLLTVIRFVCFFLAYPLTSRIGLKTNLKETVFQVYGGLRGAVGIALAISLDSSIRREANPTTHSDFLIETNKVFGMIGGVAFATLVINGTTAGPFLKWMGLADSSQHRKKIVHAMEAGFQQHLVDRFVQLLSQHRFRNVNFGLVKSHVPYLEGITKTQLLEAVERHKDTTAADEYEPPYLQGVLPYLKDEPEENLRVNPSAPKTKSTEELLREYQNSAHKATRAKRAQNRLQRRRRKSNIQHLMSGEPLSAQEMRVLFISILKAMYEQMIDHGELVDREFMAIALHQSLEFAADNVANGGLLQDWEYVHVADGPASGIINRLKKNDLVIKMVETFMGRGARKDVKYTIKRLNIERSMCFMSAHKAAQRYVEREFQGCDSELSEAARIVVSESQEQWHLAEAVLHQYKCEDVMSVTSHKFCTILLNSGQHYVTKLVKHGLLKDDEAEHWVEDIEHHLEHVLACTVDAHPGEIQIEFVDGLGVTKTVPEESTRDNSEADVKGMLDDIAEIVARQPEVDEDEAGKR